MRNILWVISYTLAFSKDPASTPLNEWPMIMAHDAATTYLHEGSGIAQWAKTQVDGGTASLLSCGARAFDWRPKLLENGSLVMHHGGVQISYDMRTAVQDIILWLQKNGTSMQDMVVLGITDCVGGDNCTQAVARLLKELEVPFITDCSVLNNLTVSQAALYSSLPTGGSLLAYNSCWIENYDPSIACSGFMQKDESMRGTSVVVVEAVDKESGRTVKRQEEIYSCYNNSTTKDFPLTRMWEYLDEVSAAGPPSDGQMYTHQAIWQETDESVVVGEYFNSSLLLDETRSSLNALITARIKSGALNASRINMVEINNVCDGGLQLLSVLRGLSSAPR